MRNGIFLAVLLVASVRFVISQATPKRTFAGKIPIYLTHDGNDQDGAEFVASVKRALSTSKKYELVAPTRTFKGFVWHIELLTITDGTSNKEHSSVASVVIQEMGLPNSYPVASMWYHKVFVLESSRSDEIAKQFLADVDAHWCDHIKSLVGNCPRELLFPVYQ